MTRGLFITASGTDIGKTLVACAIAAQLRAKGERVTVLKPVMSGFVPGEASGSDAGRLLAAAGEEITEETIAACSPWRFAAPVSPNMAAAREGRTIDMGALIDHSRDALARAGDESVLIEGIGGVMAPLTARETVLDWIAGAGLPALVVGGSYLGGLSHTLTAVNVLKSRGVYVAGVVVSESAESPVPVEETIAFLRDFLSGIPILHLPRLDPAANIWDQAPDLTVLLDQPGCQR